MLAMAEEGGFLHAPDIYMQKIAYGKKYEELEIDPESPANEIVKKFKSNEALLEIIKLINFF